MFGSTRELEQAVEGYIDYNNVVPEPSIRTKTAGQIRAAIVRFCHRIHNSGHYGFSL